MIIPRRLLFSSSLGSSAQISPAGDMLAFAQRGSASKQGIWIRTLSDGKRRRLVSSNNVQSVVWSGDGNGILYLEDTDGSEQYACKLVDLAGDVKQLSPPGISARFLSVAFDHPDEVLIEMGTRGRQRLDVHLLNISTGQSRCVAVNPGDVVGWVADQHLNVRAALATLNNGGFRLLVRQDANEEWREVRKWGSDEHGHPLFFSADGRHLYLIANHGAETNRLIALDVSSGQETVVAEDSDFDVVNALQDPVTGVPQAAVVSAERQRMVALETAIAEDLAAIANDLGDSFRVFNRSRDGNIWSLSALSDLRPPSCWVYDGRTRRTSPAIDEDEAVSHNGEAHMRPVAFRARDGLQLRGYLTLPINASKRRPGPAILKVHGGPWARDIWGFDPMVQWLANRGYAVLQVNYRGSSGFGKSFLAAGHRQWGRKMQDDLVDGADWLVAEGVADPARIGIMGASFGGYATLAALSLVPDKFAAGVCMFGPSDLLSFLRNVPTQWAAYRALLHTRVGDPETDAEYLRAVSPIETFAAIESPLLVAHGANDARVPCEEADRFAAAVRSVGRSIEYLVFTNEGHGFTRLENRLYLCGKIEQFLSVHLGGSCEPEESSLSHSGVWR